MSSYSSCSESENVICKHIRSTITVYVNLDKRVASGETVETSTVDSGDESLLLGSPEVIEEDTTVGDGPCKGVVLKAGRAIAFTVSGGTLNEDETIITAGFVTSDGQEDYVDCRLLIEGTPDGSESV